MEKRSDRHVTLDLQRQQRCGYPEVVYAEGKDAETLIEIFQALRANQDPALATRVSPDKASRLQAAFADGNYNEMARTYRLPAVAEGEHAGRVGLITAGTSDRPVAEEARETMLWMGVDVVVIADVGVAGPHRLPERLADLKSVDAVVVVAGMEGALPSVAGGYLDCPVIAVPTSVGYGANLGGIAALLGMLNSCAANVAVVNIDAGFKGGYLAGLIANRRQTREQHQSHEER
jgi:hypothetical protein